MQPAGDAPGGGGGNRHLFDPDGAVGVLDVAPEGGAPPSDHEPITG